LQSVAIDFFFAVGGMGFSLVHNGLDLLPGIPAILPPLPFRRWQTREPQKRIMLPQNLN
jgi:hypothetical protein